MAQDLSPEQLQMLQELEMEMLADVFNRLTSACTKKCIAPKYSDAELGKGEAVCLDRCVSKYLDIHDRIGKKLGELTAQEANQLKK